MNPVRYQVRHETIYQYPETVPHVQSEARVQPRNMPWQQLHSEELVLTPDTGDRREHLDFFGNRALYFSIQEPHTEASVLSTFTVDLFPDQRPNAHTSVTEWRSIAAWLDEKNQEAARDARPWTYPSPRIQPIDTITAYASESFFGEIRLMEACRHFMERVHREFRYDPESTTAATAVEESFELRAGVCQDFAHVMLCGLRGLGLPCRYVSGYLETLPPPGQVKLVGADATHAWISVYDPSLGWVDFDPTNNVLPLSQHITLGWGRDFGDVIPVKGVVTGGDHQRIDVSVDVRKLDG